MPEAPWRLNVPLPGVPFSLLTCQLPPFPSPVFRSTSPCPPFSLPPPFSLLPCLLPVLSLLHCLLPVSARAPVLPRPCPSPIPSRSRCGNEGERWKGGAEVERVDGGVRWGHWIRNALMRGQTLEDSLSDLGGGGTHGRSTIGVPLDSRPWIPYPRFPYPMPPP